MVTDGTARGWREVGKYLALPIRVGSAGGPTRSRPRPSGYPSIVSWSVFTVWRVALRYGVKTGRQIGLLALEELCHCDELNAREGRLVDGPGVAAAVIRCVDHARRGRGPSPGSLGPRLSPTRRPTVSGGDPVTIQCVGDALPCPPLCAYGAGTSASGVDAGRLTETDTLRLFDGERFAGARSDHAYGYQPRDR